VFACAQPKSIVLAVAIAAEASRRQNLQFSGSIDKSACHARTDYGPDMGFIYCLFSSEDGLPRYIGQTRGDVSRRHKQHLAAALDKDEKGAVCDWIRGVLRQEHAVGIRVIQEDVNPKDLGMFESYWIEQFPSLLNNGASSRRKPTATAQKIIEAVQSSLRKGRRKRK
jgi:hypothetical protein